MKPKHYVLFALALILVYIYFSVSSKKKKSSSNIAYYEESDFQSSEKRKERIQKSLFDEDSKFLEFKDGPEFEVKSEYTEEELEQRKKLIIEKSKYLADLFPNNSVIPRALSRKEEKEKLELEKKMSEIRNKFLNGIETNKTERGFYYTNRLKTTEDRLEIFRYIFGKPNEGNFDIDKLEPILKERYLDMIELEKAYKEEIKKNE